MFGNGPKSKILKNKNGNTCVNRRSGFDVSYNLASRKNRNEKNSQEQ